MLLTKVSQVPGTQVQGKGVATHGHAPHLALARDVLPQQLQLVHLEPVHLLLVAVAAAAAAPAGPVSAVNGHRRHGTRYDVLLI